MSADAISSQMKIALSMFRKLNLSTAREALGRAGGLGRFFAMTDDEMAAAGLSADVFGAREREARMKEGAAEMAFACNSRVDTFFCLDDNYPRRLAQCDDAPVMLYRLGSCNLDSAHIVAIVGTRHATAQGVDFTRRFVADLAGKIPDLVIVSGLAYGIDIAAHRAALDAGVPTVAVVAHGLDSIYPSAHRQAAAGIVRGGGAIVTEYPSGTAIMKPYFLARNRIVAGLCDCTVVVESAHHGGALATARLAAAYDREVFAVPGRVSDTYSAGTNRLIATRAASLLTDADSLIDAMGWKPTEKAADEPRLFRPLSDEEQRLLDIIAANPTFTSADIAAEAALPYARVADLLFRLEMDDAIISIPGGRFALPNY